MPLGVVSAEDTDGAPLTAPASKPVGVSAEKQEFPVDASPDEADGHAAAEGGPRRAEKPEVGADSDSNQEAKLVEQNSGLRQQLPEQPRAPDTSTNGRTATTHCRSGTGTHSRERKGSQSPDAMAEGQTQDSKDVPMEKAGHAVAAEASTSSEKVLAAEAAQDEVENFEEADCGTERDLHATWESQASPTRRRRPQTLFSAAALKRQQQWHAWRRATAMVVLPLIIVGLPLLAARRLHGFWTTHVPSQAKPFINKMSASIEEAGVEHASTTPSAVEPLSPEPAPGNISEETVGFDEQPGSTEVSSLEGPALLADSQGTAAKPEAPLWMAAVPKLLTTWEAGTLEYTPEVATIVRAFFVGAVVFLIIQCSTRAETAEDHCETAALQRRPEVTEALNAPEDAPVALTRKPVPRHHNLVEKRTRWCCWF